MSSKRSSASQDGATQRPSALAVEPWPIERPIPYENNPRVVPKSAIDKVAASIAEFGFRQPIVVPSLPSLGETVLPVGLVSSRARLESQSCLSRRG